MRQLPFSGRIFCGEPISSPDKSGLGFRRKCSRGPEDDHRYPYTCLELPLLRDLSQHIKTTEDLIAFRTRYPELYRCSLTEAPVDNSDALIADMDKTGVALTLVQARPGYVTNDQVAQSAARHPDRLCAIARVGHDQEAAGYHDDPGPTREWAPGEIERA